jgi:hypothetical protein
MIGISEVMALYRLIIVRGYLICQAHVFGNVIDAEILIL